MIPYIVSHAGTITVFANGKNYIFNKDHRHYKDVIEALRTGDASALDRYNESKLIENYSAGNIKVQDGVIYYMGVPLHRHFVDRVLAQLRQGFPFQNILNFLNNLMENSSMRAVDELFDFLSHWALPLTPDGCFLAYKRVTNDYKDYWTGEIDNHIGARPKMPRNMVDDDSNEDCSKGFHVGALDYVLNYHPNEGRIIIVKVNPKDVVSVPRDLNCTKLRCCEYEVVGEYQEALADSPIYTSNPVRPVYPIRQETTEGFNSEVHQELGTQ